MSLRTLRSTAGLAASCCARLTSRSTRPVSNSQLLRRAYSDLVPTRRDRPFRMAVVGSGPAGFYTAYRVMSLIDGAKVDMYEALPVPFGLVRFGVAPDHPEVKNCEDKFTEVASSPNFTFIGNVAVGHAPHHPGGQSVQLRTLLRHYDAVLLAYGASKDRTLGIPGESLRRIYSAREFVGWYNGLPEFAGLEPDLDQEAAVVVGQGNVAMDVARILLKGPSSALGATDIAAHAADALARSRVRRVRVVGRRGPLQASFTVKELRELVSLEGARMMHPVDQGLLPPDIKALPRARRRLLEVMLKGSAAASQEQLAEKSWDLGFCMSPAEFRPDPSDPGAVGATGFQTNILSDLFDPNATITRTQPDVTMIESPLVFRSIGYKSEPMPEFQDLGVRFDERRGVISNDGVHGRVAPVVADEEKGRRHFPGLYCAGWVKRGPTGVIASTMEDAFTTAAAITGDWKAGNKFLGDWTVVEGRTSQSPGWDGVKSEGPKELAACAVDWEGWLAIDRAEKERGKLKGKEREKFTAVEEMLPLSTSKRTT